MFQRQTQLSIVQKQLLKSLHTYGMRASHLQAWRPREGHATFWDEHMEACIYLVIVEKLDPKDTIAEINKLSCNEAKFLHDLYEFGLRGDHLRKYQCRSESFIPTKEHKQRFINLVSQEKHGPEEALRLLYEDKKNPLDLSGYLVTHDNDNTPQPNIFFGTWF